MDYEPFSDLKTISIEEATIESWPKVKAAPKSGIISKNGVVVKATAPTKKGQRKVA